MRKWILAIGLFLLLAMPVVAQAPALFGDPYHTLVLCEPCDAAGTPDPYASLAHEIAAAEGLMLFDNWPDALAARPWTILWVAAPQMLTEERFASAGMLLREHGPVSLGLISGSTIDHARELWHREPARQGDLVSIVPREGVIETHAGDAVASSAAITSDTVIAALQAAQVISYQGHGTRSLWHVGEGEDGWRLTASDLSDLDGPVVIAGACQTFKVWSDASIAMAFADQGAAAYVGYLHSPQGYAFGEPKGFAEARTWPEFSLGTLVAVQNCGLGQGHLAWPYLFVLGDPRISLADGPAYTVAQSDSFGSDGERRLHLADLPAGPVPIFVPGGAEYPYVIIADAHAHTGDPFYDADLQMIDVGPHKYILYDSPGGDTTVVLRTGTPWLAHLFEPLGDALDHMTLIHHTRGSLAPNLVLMVGVWLAAAWQVLRKRARLADNLPPAIAAGATLAVARAAYAVYRAPYLAHMYDGYLRTMDTTWDVGVPFLLSSLLLSTGAAWLLLSARRWWGKALAAPLVVAPTSLMAVLWLSFSAGINLLARQQYGAPLYGYAMGTMGLIASAVEGALVAAVVWVAQRSIRKG